MQKPRPLLSEQEIRKRVEGLASEIIRHYPPHAPVTIVCVLKGAMVFCSDLMREIARQGGPPLILETLSAGSYKGTESTGQVRLRYEFECKGKSFLIVEDILDTGRTLSIIRDELLGKGAAGIRTCVLLDKKSRRKVAFEADHAGFQIDDVFVVGYGLDRDQTGRELPYIGKFQ